MEQKQVVLQSGLSPKPFSAVLIQLYIPHNDYAKLSSLLSSTGPLSAAVRGVIMSSTLMKQRRR